MVDDPGYAILVSWITLNDNGTISDTTQQWVKIDASLNAGEKMVGLAIQPTPNGLLLIGGLSIDEAAYKGYSPIGFCTRNTSTGAPTSTFSPVPFRSLLPGTTLNNTCYYEASDGTKQVYVGGGVTATTPNANIYRIVLDASGTPVSMSLLASLPSLGNVDSQGVTFYVQDQALWIQARRSAKLLSYRVPLDTSGLPQTTTWTLVRRQNTKLMHRSIDQAVSMSSLGDCLFMLMQQDQYPVLATIPVTPTGVDYCSHYRYFAQLGDVYKVVSRMFTHGSYTYILGDLGSGWALYKFITPTRADYPGPISIECVRGVHASSNPGTSALGLVYYPFLRSGIIKATPSNQGVIATVPFSISSTSVYNMCPSIVFTGPLDPTVSTIWASEDYGAYTCANITLDRTNAVWNYTHTYMRYGAHYVFFRALDTNGNYVDKQGYSIIDTHIPTVKVLNGSFPNNVACLELTDDAAGLALVKIAQSDSYPFVPTYTTVYNKTVDDGVYTRTKKIQYGLNYGTAPAYVSLQATDNLGYKLDCILSFNVHIAGSGPADVYSYSASKAYLTVDPVIPMDSLTKEPVQYNVTVQWGATIPVGDSYHTTRGPFDVYDFDKSGSFNGGTDWGYFAYLYGRWEYLGRETAESTILKYLPATNWFCCSDNPITAYSESTWYGASVLTAVLTPGVNIPARPHTTIPRKQLIRYDSSLETASYWDEKIEPRIWRLNLYGSLNAPTTVTANQYLLYD